MGPKRITGIALVVATLLLVAGAAQAVVVKGKGTLRAAGSGFAVLDFRGVASVVGAGLAVVEEDDVLRLDGHGRITPLDDGRILLEGFGRIVIRSVDDRTRVEVAGAGIRLRAKGVGRAFLKGHGRYSTDDLDDDWRDDDVIEFEEGEE